MTRAMPVFRLNVSRLCLASIVMLVAGVGTATAQTTQPTATQPKIAKQAKPDGKASTSKTSNNYAKRIDLSAVAKRLAKTQALDASWVRQALSQANYVGAIAKAVEPAPAGVVKNWAAYKARFIEPVRIEAGLEFWRQHQSALERAEQSYGVAPEIIVGIIGVETLYGRYTGAYRVIDALATLAFDFPKTHPKAAQRREYFFSELGHFLKLAKQLGRDPSSMRGSYAGAMGLPQFMPSSWLDHAVNFDEDKGIDLWGSPVDAIGSVANYLRAYGWQRQQATHFEISFDSAALNKTTLLEPDILPTFDRQTFQSLGIRLADEAASQYPGKWALIELFNGDDPPSYVAGTENFYVITRYNQSSYYAMAVIELGQAVKSARQSRRGP